jgi:hypothetical protein
MCIRNNMHELSVEGMAQFEAPSLDQFTADREQLRVLTSLHLWL